MTVDPANHPILDYLDEVRAALAANDAAALNSLAESYLQALEALQAEIESFAMVAGAGGINAQEALALEAYRTLLDGVREQMNIFAQEMADIIDASTLASIEQAILDGQQMIQLSLPLLDAAVIEGMFTRLVPEQVISLFGFLGPDSPLMAHFRMAWGEGVADLISQQMLTGFIMGMNPREIAALLESILGIPLNWGLTNVRTANLWAYRAASQANYLANSGIVKGWIWVAELSSERTCLSCINQHGSFHPITEFLNDHHNGRCSPAPVTKTYAELGFDIPGDSSFALARGEVWFNNLSPRLQEKMMGPAMYSAWLDGAFDFSQLSTPYVSDTYGLMLRESSLIGMIGERARMYYG